jgi:mannose-6-phosphate isomerase-like protein (cupin superfamily)
MRFIKPMAADAVWAEGMREIFEYRDLGIESGTDGDYVAHVIHAKGKEESDQIHQWHHHECQFQMVYILNGWAKFEYEGIGVRTLRKGDYITRSDPLVINKIDLAPYVGINYERLPGDTEAIAETAGEETSETQLVAGLRFWF